MDKRNNEPLTDAVLDNLSNRIMGLKGIDTSHDSSILIEEDNGDLFMKFMSDGGITDDKNGETLHQIFVDAKVEHEFYYERKFLMQYEHLQDFLSKVTHG